MNLPERDLENLLRHPPQPAPPNDLKQRLLAQAAASVPRSAPNPARPLAVFGNAKANGVPNARPQPNGVDEMRGRPGLGGWLRRWWPALIPAAGSLACAAVLAVQQSEMRDLRATIEALKQPSAPVETVSTAPPVVAVGLPASADTESSQDQEIARLRQTVSELESEVAQLVQLQAENAKLRTQLATAAAPGLSAEEAEAVAQARERAMNIHCVNNLKQFGLATRVWALDNQDVMPPDILSMSNELATPKVLICPADRAHQSARDWTTFTTQSSSYEFLAPSGSDSEPTRVLSRCPIHGNIGLCDGSVQMGAVTNHPDWFHERDGKLFFDQPATLQLVVPGPSK